MEISHDLLIQAMVWLCINWFRVIQIGMVWFGASYAYLRWPHVLECQI